MNYLAHIHLSFGDSDFLIGNFLSDMLSLQDARSLPFQYHKGVGLHRFIDTFTDQNENVKLATKTFHGVLSKYSPVIVDILFDFVLAKNWKDYSDLPLQDFCDKSYSTIKDHLEHVSPMTSGLINRMIDDNFLMKYTNDEGLLFVFDKLNRRAKFKVDFKTGLPIFHENYDALEQLFLPFYDKLLESCQSYISAQLQPMNQNPINLRPI
jgi:acyl carrier protein phosphodiesterase